MQSTVCVNMSALKMKVMLKMYNQRIDAIALHLNKSCRIIYKCDKTDFGNDIAILGSGGRLDHRQWTTTI